MEVVEEAQLITVMDGPWSPTALIREIVESGTQEDPFYVMDLGEVVARYHRWKELMPRVEPFYGEILIAFIRIWCGINTYRKSNLIHFLREDTHLLCRGTIARLYSIR